MKRVKLTVASEIKIKGILGYLKRKVTPFGNSAKVDCPKEYLGKTVYLVILDDENIEQVEKENENLRKENEQLKKENEILHRELEKIRKAQDIRNSLND